MAGGAEVAAFHTVLCWDRLAETTAAHVKRGDPLYVEGRLEYRRFQDGEGTERGTVEIVADDVQFLGRRRDPRDTSTTAAETSADVDLDDVSL
jgi:single stranded DNA-binding protein